MKDFGLLCIQAPLARSAMCTPGRSCPCASGSIPARAIAVVLLINLIPFSAAGCRGERLGRLQAEQFLCQQILPC